MILVVAVEMVVITSEATAVYQQCDRSEGCLSLPDKRAPAMCPADVGRWVRCACVCELCQKWRGVDGWVVRVGVS